MMFALLQASSAAAAAVAAAESTPAFSRKCLFLLTDPSSEVHALGSIDHSLFHECETYGS